MLPNPFGIYNEPNVMEPRGMVAQNAQEMQSSGGQDETPYSRVYDAQHTSGRDGITPLSRGGVGESE